MKIVSFVATVSTFRGLREAADFCPKAMRSAASVRRRFRDHTIGQTPIACHASIANLYETKDHIARSGSSGTAFARLMPHDASGSTRTILAGAAGRIAGKAPDGPRGASGACGARRWPPGGRRPPCRLPRRHGKETGVEVCLIDVNRTLACYSAVPAGPRIRARRCARVDRKRLPDARPQLSPAFIGSPGRAQVRREGSDDLDDARGVGGYVDRPLRPPGFGGYRRASCPSPPMPTRSSDGLSGVLFELLPSSGAAPENSWRSSIGATARSPVREQAVRAISMELQSCPKGVD